MKPLFFTLLLLLALATVASAQEKGVDSQNERIKDGGNNRTPAINGGKVDTVTRATGPAVRLRARLRLREG